MFMNPIQLHKEVIEEIKNTDYFFTLYINLVVKEYPDTRIEDEQNQEKICSFWNIFWFLLPDSPSIHRGPFNKICELAEGSYLEQPKIENADE